MGLKYHALDSQLFVTAIKSNVQQSLEVTDSLRNGSQHLIHSLGAGTELSGAAYTAGKGLFTDVINPSTVQFHRVIEDVQSDLDAYTSAENEVVQYGDLDEEDLKQQISIKQEQKAQLEQMQQVYANVTASGVIAPAGMDFGTLQQAINEIERQIYDLQKQLTALENFEYQTAPLFKDSLGAFHAIVQGIAVINQITTDASGHYFTHGADMGWLSTLEHEKLDSESGSEQALEAAVSNLGLTPDAIEYWEKEMQDELKNVPKDQWNAKIKEAVQNLKFDDNGNILQIGAFQQGVLVLKNGVYDKALTELANKELDNENWGAFKDNLAQLGFGLGTMLSGGLLAVGGGMMTLGGGGFSLTGAGAPVGAPVLAGGVSLAKVGGATAVSGAGIAGNALSKMNVAAGSVQYSFAKNYEEQVSKSSQSLKKVGSNKEANKIAQENGFNSAEDLKEDYVGKSSISKFNMKYDPKTGEIILESIKDTSVQVHTGLYK